MSKIREIPYEGRIYRTFMCPGCNCVHTFNDTWGFNGDLDKPTVTPSILVTGRGEPNYRCHSFITDGKIQFLNDCSHELAGQTVEIPDDE